MPCYCARMEQQGVYGVGQAVFAGHEQLVLVRPLEGVLGLEMLHYQSQLRDKAAITAETELPSVSKEELRLASKLIEVSRHKKFDIGQYQDEYTNKLQAVIEAKVAGKEVVKSPDDDTSAPVINLMDAPAQERGTLAPCAPSKPPAKTKPARTRQRSSRRHAG